MNKFNTLFNKVIAESSISRIYDYIKNFECATISASRGKITNVTENTFVPPDYENERNLTKEENRKRNSLLKAKLLHLGYGVTSLDGKYAEAGTTFPGKETSYFVVNIKDDPEFFDNLFELSEYFNQDSFLYKPKNTVSAQLVGTNYAERNEIFGTPGYNQTIDIGTFNPSGFDGALSKIRNKMFQFKLNENKNQSLSFVGKELLSEETFEKLNVTSKGACANSAKKINLNKLLVFEDYSNKINPIKMSNPKILGKGFEYVNCNNACLILEDSLNRTLEVMKGKDFAIITAYRGNMSKRENIRRNRMLRAELNKLHMGVHQLVGHWQEAPDNKDYRECLPSELTDVIERSYLIAKPEDMSFNEFKNVITNLLTIDNATQDAALIKNSEGIFAINKQGDMDKVGSYTTIGKIGQAYSQHVKKMNVPFIFEGIETPVTNIGKQLWHKYHIHY